MRRRFVVCVDNATKEQQNVITALLASTPGIESWHWFHDVWLVVDPYREWNARTLRDALNAHLPDASNIVLQIDGTANWSGHGDSKMFRWLQQAWSER